MQEQGAGKAPPLYCHFPKVGTGGAKQGYSLEGSVAGASLIKKEREAWSKKYYIFSFTGGCSECLICFTCSLISGKDRLDYRLGYYKKLNPLGFIAFQTNSIQTQGWT